MKTKIQVVLFLLLLSTVCLYAQSIDPYQVTALSVSGKKYGDKPTVLSYSTVRTLKNALWDGSVFTAHRDGVFIVTISFVKDAHYNNGTQDDVYMKIYKEDTAGIRTGMGFAWSGEGTGKRGTGAYTVAVELKEGEKILTEGNCPAGKTWYLSLYNLTIYSLPAYIY